MKQIFVFDFLVAVVSQRPPHEQAAMRIDGDARILSRAHDARCRPRIAEALAGGGRALVHCAAGISRSSTIVLAYLVARRGYTLREAFEHVHARRFVVWPNAGFMEALIQLERRSIALEQEQEQPAALTKKSSSMCLDEYQAWGQYDPNGLGAVDSHT